MKSMILAGGSGSRLGRMTTAVNKHLLPIGGGPVIDNAYKLAHRVSGYQTLIVSNPEDLQAYANLFPNIYFTAQITKNGIGGAIKTGRHFCDSDSVFVVLGDNIFSHIDVLNIVHTVRNLEGNFGCHIWVKEMNDPSSYGVVEISKTDKVVGLEEKPVNPKSNLALTGVYAFDKHIWEYVRSLFLSERKEYEITDIIKKYHNITCHRLKDDWYDIGSCQSSYWKTCQGINK